MSADVCDGGGRGRKRYVKGSKHQRPKGGLEETSEPLVVGPVKPVEQQVRLTCHAVRTLKPFFVCHPPPPQSVTWGRDERGPGTRVKPLGPRATLKLHEAARNIPHFAHFENNPPCLRLHCSR